MALRIFEPRYVRMVKEACAAQGGFGICMLDVKGDKQQNQHIHSLGTYAEVIDFDLLEDGLLGITVEGKSCFRINHIQTQEDGLRTGQCDWVANWRCEVSPELMSPIDKRLREIFDKYPEVNSLYHKPNFDDPIWVIYRWLEILPVKAEQKQMFLQEKDCAKALEFLTNLVE